MQGRYHGLTPSTKAYAVDFESAMVAVACLVGCCEDGRQGCQFRGGGGGGGKVKSRVVSEQARRVVG